MFNVYIYEFFMSQYDIVDILNFKNSESF